MVDTAIKTNARDQMQVVTNMHVFTRENKVGVLTLDSAADLDLLKSDDGNATRIDVELVAGTFISIGSFAEWENPHVISPGTLVHVVYINDGNNTVNYLNIDISDWSISTPVTIATHTGLQTNNRNDATITYTTSGDLIVVYSWDDGTTLTTLAWRSTNTGATWDAIDTPVGTTTNGNRRRIFAAFPAAADQADEDAGLIFYDSHNADIWAAGYDQSLDTWSLTLVRSDSAIDFGNDVRRFDTSIDKDGNVIVAVMQQLNLSTADVNVYSVDMENTPIVTTKTDAWVNPDENSAVAVTCDWDSDEIYAWLVYGTTYHATVAVKQKISTDGGTTWGSETAMSADAEDDLRLVASAKAISNLYGGFVQPVWFNDDLDDIFINQDNDTEIDIAGGGGGGGTSNVFLSSVFYPLNHVGSVS